MIRRTTSSFLLGAALAVSTQCTSEGELGTDPGPAATIDLSLDPASATITHRRSDDVTVRITRGGGFTGAVNLTVEEAPTGVTGTVSEMETSGDVTTATITILVDVSVPPGTYDLTARASASGVQDATAAFTLTVNENNAWAVFAGCRDSDKPVWFAFMDGTDPWVHVPDVGFDVYDFRIEQPTGAFAYVTEGPFGTNLYVNYRTQAQLTAAPLRLCRPPGTKTVFGTVDGIGMGNAVRISLGGAFAFPFANGPFQLDEVGDGPRDLVGFRSPLDSAGSPPVGIIRRDLDALANDTLAPMDFANTDSFPADSADVTVMGLAGGETIFLTTSFHTPRGEGMCERASLHTALDSSLTSTKVVKAYGVPPVNVAPFEFHQFSVTATLEGDPDESRGATMYVAEFGSADLQLRSPAGMPDVTSLGGSYQRLSFDFDMATEYRSASASYSANDHRVIMTGNIDVYGGTMGSLFLKDFTGVVGWMDSFAPPNGVPVDWQLSFFGGSGAPCTDGAETYSASVFGTINF